MTSGEEAIESPGAPIDAELAAVEVALTDLLERIEGRLKRLEPYRAQLQLKAREAEGRPVEAIAARELSAHLEAALAQEPDYRAQRSLSRALAALRDEPDPAASEQRPAEGSEAASTPGAAGRSIGPAAEADMPDHEAQPIEEYAAASAAVAEMFSPRADSAPVAAAPEPIANEPAASRPGGEAPDEPAEPARAATVPEPDAVEIKGGLAEISEPNIAVAPAFTAAVNGTGPAFDNVDAAQVDVLAQVARLREPAAAAVPPSPPAQSVVPMDIELVATTDLPPLPEPQRLYAGPKSPSVSLEGTMANVAKAVAATVAAAGRIADTRLERKTSNQDIPQPARQDPPVAHGIFGRPAVRRAPSGIGANSSLDNLAVEESEIRFVSRPAHPVFDAPSKLPPTVNPPAPPVVPTADLAFASDTASPSNWEEASVEIRGDASRSQPARPAGTSADQGFGGRASGVLNRFARVLRRDKD